MASNYPGSLDSFDTIASDKKTSDSVGGRTHWQMHNDLGDAIEAVQAELGTDPAGAYATVKLRLEALESEVVVTHPSTDDVKVVAAGQTVHYDSGVRNIAGLLLNSWTGDAQLRRVNSTVTLYLSLNGSSATDTHVLTLPSGFTVASNDTVPFFGVTGASVSTASSASAFVITWDDKLLTATGSAVSRLNISFDTADAIPGSLPGTLVSAAPA